MEAHLNTPEAEAAIPASAREDNVPPHIKATRQRRLDHEKAMAAAQDAAAAEVPAAEIVAEAVATPAEPAAVEPVAQPAAVVDDSLARQNAELLAQIAAMQAKFDSMGGFIDEQKSKAEAERKRAAEDAAAAAAAALELTAEEEAAWGGDKDVVSKIARKAAAEATAAVRAELAAANAKIASLESQGATAAANHARSEDQKFGDAVKSALPELNAYFVGGKPSAAYISALQKPVVAGGVATYLDRLVAANNARDEVAAIAVLREALNIKQAAAANQSKAAIPGTSPAANANAGAAREPVITRQQYEKAREEAWAGKISRADFALFSQKYQKQFLTPAAA